MLEATRAGLLIVMFFKACYTKRALGGKRESRHIEGVYFDALFETHRNLANLRYCSLELSNGRCPGCDLYHSLWRILPARTIPVRAQGVSIPIIIIVGAPKQERYTFISAWALTLSVRL